jgi:hypothetical protein
LADLRAKISKVFPQVDWSDPSWGIYDGDGFSFEFNVGEEDPSDDIMIHVRGRGPAVEALLNLAQATGWYLLDCSQGEWLHHCKDVNVGWTRFQAYRDRVNSATKGEAGKGGGALPR